MAPQKRKRHHDEPIPVEDPPRRTTRHTKTASPEPEKQLRSGRVRAKTLEQTSPTTKTSEPSSRGRTDAPKLKTATNPAPPSQPVPAPVKKTTRRTRGHTADLDELALPDATTKRRSEPHPAQPRTRQTAVPPPKIPTSPVAPKTEPKAQANTSRPRTRIPPPKPPAQSHLQAPASSLTDPAAASAITPRRRTSLAIAHQPPPATPRADRNIDKVVLGNICFKTWYPSYYSKEVLGDVTGNVGRENAGGAAKIGGGKKDKEVVLDRLHVCPCCFKYSKELVSWSEHVRFCERRAEVPGTKIYTHPKGRKAKGSTAKSIAKDVEEGEWSVWEVDGEVDVLFCQNLSLFAKLFLDNKSVFFDVTGFNYFLLVHTPAPDPQTSQPSTPQICGFFSKEKMSWDNNNLACILVFPPWQRKGLGAMLMGVSYEISKREGVLGGPEKPISELGRKGYKRYWAGEIARWILSLQPTDLTDSQKGNAKQNLVDIEDCSKATWIVQEDCLAILRDMGIVEEAGIGPPKQVVSEDEEVEQKEVKDVPRVRIDKEAVRRWVEKHRIDLERTCDPDGFLEGYAVTDPEVANED